MYAEAVKALLRLHQTKEAQSIVIFGAGEYGVDLQRKLAAAGVPADYFCDNGLEKQGKDIEGIRCLNFDELLVHKNKALVLVSPQNGDAIYAKLREHQFSCVLPEAILELLRYLPIEVQGERLRDLPPFGHYYSLYPDLNEIHREEKRIFDRTKTVREIDFNEERQLEILGQMTALYDTLPQWNLIPEEGGRDSYRFHFKNLYLDGGDAVALHCMLRILQPQKVIEVGSGYSTAVMLDTNAHYLDNRIDISVIEPYPQRLKSLLKETDYLDMQTSGLQAVPTAFFETLDAGDILFIDSTHVTKINSDVNYLFFEILPRLKPGVYIHLHDIFYPFEYPEQWIFAGKIWNEAYLLRAFLQNNARYSIQYFHNMMQLQHEELFKKKWPFAGIPFQGASLWLKKMF